MSEERWPRTDRDAEAQEALEEWARGLEEMERWADMLADPGAELRIMEVSGVLCMGLWRS